MIKSLVSFFLMLNYCHSVESIFQVEVMYGEESSFSETRVSIPGPKENLIELPAKASWKCKITENKKLPVPGTKDQMIDMRVLSCSHKGPKDQNPAIMLTSFCYPGLAEDTQRIALFTSNEDGKNGLILNISLTCNPDKNKKRVISN